MSDDRDTSETAETFLDGRAACSGSGRPAGNVQRAGWGAGYLGTCQGCGGRIEVVCDGTAEWHDAPSA